MPNASPSTSPNRLAHAPGTRLRMSDIFLVMLILAYLNTGHGPRASL